MTKTETPLQTQLLEQQAKDYASFSPEQMKNFIDVAYNKNSLSFAVIAEMVGTYSNKIRRDAIKLGIKPKNKSEAQSNALQQGRHKHPTKGTVRSENVKNKISDSMGESWENMSDEEKQRRSDMGKESWEGRTYLDKKSTQKKSHKAILQTAKTGSNLEHYLAGELIKAGYLIDIHKKHIMQNERLEIDILIPKLSIAIEVDGPSHHKPIWGRERLEKTQKSDREKNGLILGYGMVLIRVACDKTPSSYIKRNLFKQLLKQVIQIEKEFPKMGHRLINIGEIND